MYGKVPPVWWITCFFMFNRWFINQLSLHNLSLVRPRKSSIMVSCMVQSLYVCPCSYFFSSWIISATNRFITVVLFFGDVVWTWCIIFLLPVNCVIFGGKVGWRVICNIINVCTPVSQQCCISSWAKSFSHAYGNFTTHVPVLPIWQMVNSQG